MDLTSAICGVTICIIKQRKYVLIYWKLYLVFYSTYLQTDLEAA